MTRPEPNVQLREARLHSGLSREELAKRLGISGYTVGRWERGEAWPDEGQVRQLCEELQREPEELGFDDGALVGAGGGHDKSVPAGSPSTGAEGVYDPAIPVLPAAPLIGRQRDLESLRRRLLGSGGGSVTALSGLPGVGKTTLACALAHDKRVRAHFRDGILWAGLGPQPNLAGLLSRWSALLGLSPRQTSALQSSEDWTKALREAIGARRMLLIIDDAWRAEEALTCRVGGPNCAHLITTRFPVIATQISVDGGQALHELDAEQSIDLLRRLAPQAVALELAKAQELVEAVGGLPLALTLMGNYLRKQGYSGQARRIQSALQRLSDAQERLRLSEPRAPAESHPSLPGESALSLQSIIAVTEQMLSEEARQALYALAVFPARPGSFSEAAALAVCGCVPEVLDQLNDTGLLESSVAGRYTLHQTIADFARLHLSLQDTYIAYGRLIVYTVAFMNEHKKDYELLDQESSIILTALEAAYTREKQSEFVTIALAFTPYMLIRAWYTQAEQYVQRAYEAALDQGDSQSLIDAQQYRGEIAHKQGDLAQAEAYLQEGLRLARQLEDKERISALLTDLGWVMWKRGEYQQAEACLLEGLALARQTQNSKRICDLLRVLGSLKNDQGEYSQSEEYLREGFDIARQLGDREQTFALLINLGATAGQLGDFKQAESYFKEGLILARQLGHREGICALLANLGDAVSESGKYAEAESYFQEGLALARQIGQREWICALLINLATMLRKQGIYGEAEAYLSEALSLGRQISRPQMIAHSLYEYGNLYLDQQHLELAKTAFNDVLISAPEGTRDITALAQYGLARVAVSENNIEEAQRMGRLSVEALLAIKHRQYQEVKHWLSLIPKMN